MQGGNNELEIHLLIFFAWTSSLTTSATETQLTTLPQPSFHFDSEHSMAENNRHEKHQNSIMNNDQK